MTPNEYQDKAHTFAAYSGKDEENWVYPVMGLAEEAGEVCGKFAKAIRDCGGKISADRRMEICKELGDVCWMVSEIATLLNMPLEEVMIHNIEKLTSRKIRGVIHGNGDNR